MPTNDFLAFADGTGANVVTQDEYVALLAGSLVNGYQAGLAESEQCNKTWRQASVMASAVAAAVAAVTSADVLDNGHPEVITANLIKAWREASQQFVASVAGSNAITGTVIGLTSYVQASLLFIVAANNTGAATININGLGAKNIFSAGVPLVGEELIAGQVVTMTYDGTQFQLEATAAFSQNLSTASVRSVIQKLRDVKSVLDFTGATMDDIFQAAATWSNANKMTVFIPPGVYALSSGVFAQDWVSFAGGGMPTISEAGTSLEGGTVIKGTLRFTGRFVSVTDMGADRGSASGLSSGDAFVVENAAGVTAHIENIIGLARSSAEAIHGVAIEGFASVTGGNIVGSTGEYGVVLKLRYSNLGNITGMNAGSDCVLLKCDADHEDSGNFIVGNILAVGNGTTPYGLRLLCINAGTTDLDIRYASIGDISYSGVNVGWAVDANNQSTGTVTIQDVVAGNLCGTHTSDAVYITAAGGANIYNISHGDIQASGTGSSAGVATYNDGFSIMGANVNCVIPAGSSRINDAIAIGAGTLNSVSFNNIRITADFTLANGGIDVTNPTECIVAGRCGFESYGTNPVLRNNLTSTFLPASGRFVAGEFVKKYGAPSKDGNNMVLIGWLRVTTGTGQVLNTDWYAQYISTVTPAT